MGSRYLLFWFSSCSMMTSRKISPLAKFVTENKFTSRMVGSSKKSIVTVNGGFVTEIQTKYFNRSVNRRNVLPDFRTVVARNARQVPKFD
jgi:hypothetical protein